MRGSVPQEGRRVPCRASQLWVPLPWCSPPLRLLHFRAFKQGPGQGSCSLSDEPQLPRTSTASPWFPWGWGKPSCCHPVSPRTAHTHPRRWHLGGALGEECPAPPGGLGIRGGTGVCRCRAPAAHACGKGSAPAIPGWNLGVSGHFLPLPFPAAGARGLRAMGWLELARGGTGRLRFTAPEGNGF